jgi:hypothetical protein
MIGELSAVLELPLIQQNAELDQHLSSAQKGNVENFNMLDVDRCLCTVVLAITDPTI